MLTSELRTQDFFFGVPLAILKSWIISLTREAQLQFTIESRQLTHQTTARAEDSSTIIEAANPDDAISRFVRQSDCELMSFLKPAEGRESIATIRKDDSVFLVRVYEA